MSIYSTTTSLQVQMIGTTFDTLTTSLADKCLDQAQAEINKYLSKRYDVSSWSTYALTPPMVTTICDWLAMAYFFAGNSRGGKDAFKRADWYLKLGMNNLQDILDYKLDLVDSGGSIVPDSANTSYKVISSTEGYANTFNEDGYKKWKVSKNKLTDIASERSGG